MKSANSFLATDLIRIKLIGFTEQAELERLAKMFTHAKQGLRRWQVVNAITDADMLLIAATTEGDLQTWLAEPYGFTSGQLIAYAPQALSNAAWHLPRNKHYHAPSSLDFFRLISKINEANINSFQNAFLINKAEESLVNNSEKLALASDAPLRARSGKHSETYKILFVGSVGSGKTTAIQTLAEGKMLMTEALPSDHAQFLKKTTTVAMDYAPVLLNGQRIHIYGAPGQRRFSFMSDILSYKTHGLVILVSNAMSQPLLELNYYLTQHHRLLTQCPAVIGVTHNDINPRPSLKEYHQYLEQMGKDYPVFKVDARNKMDMLKLLETVVQTSAATTLNLEAMSSG